MDPVCVNGAWVCQCIDAGPPDAALVDSAAAPDESAPSDAAMSDTAPPDDAPADGAPTDASSDAGAGAGCIASGGTVSSGLCCAATGPFPNTCLIGACGCAPASSHMVPTCSCPKGTCFDGARCK
jgi:hypothetical protein